ncbi:unnamed protein product [Adineta ricciae]|uniref:LamG-like jellyroll fold domain-containing protein n=1 Tax=Adineta ricciae TaxID=249248 RepID=A0A815HM97_ADIRI|nr:unnamed protein product [Adineta ricciae]CAF1353660.1 unnamed protein product [Adineta ricciae]
MYTEGLLPFLLVLSAYTANSVQVGVIKNVRLVPSGTIINTTYHTCLCILVTSSQNIQGFNYNSQNDTCALFTNYSSSFIYILQNDSDSTFYFRQLPPVISMNTNYSTIQTQLTTVLTNAAATTIKTTTTKLFNAGKFFYVNKPTTASSLPVISIFWPFDNSAKDLNNVYATNFSGITYSALGITGYGAALSLTYSATSYVMVSTPYVNLRNRSFTIDLWANPASGMSANDYPFVVICQTTSPNYRCLQALLRSGKPMLTLYYSDCESSRSVKSSTWIHLAFIYDYASNTMSLYVNGYLDTNCSSVSPFQGTPNTTLIIGGAKVLKMYYEGLIDQLSVVTRVKSASEILDTATLVVYYSFINQNLLDSGPNLINGTGINTTFTAGRVDDAIVFNGTASYIQINNLILLGTTGWPYSFAFWIYPYSTQNGTLIHMYMPTAATIQCIPILGFTSSGSLVAQSWNATQILTIHGPVISSNSWIHIAHTYSSNGSIRLYVNGSLVAISTATSPNSTLSPPVTVIVGHCGNTTLCSCSSGAVVPGQYRGLMDEFRIYSRACNASEVYALANP